MYFSRIRNQGDRSLKIKNLEDVHHLVWKFFPGVQRGERPFLYRYELEQGRPCFYVVSETVPVAWQGWSLEHKAYAPQLSAGDMLYFSARINPIVSVEGKRHDAVAYFKTQNPDWQKLPPQELKHSVLATWLERRAEANGFSIIPNQIRVHDYEQHDFHKGRGRGKGSHNIRLSVATLEGSLTVTDPEAFNRLLTTGLGHAKAYGCGMFLVRRTN
jgi:CRISPR system Cascade subunit CasE